MKKERVARMLRFSEESSERKLGICKEKNMLLGVVDAKVLEDFDTSADGCEFRIIMSLVPKTLGEGESMAKAVNVNTYSGRVTFLSAVSKNLGVIGSDPFVAVRMRLVFINGDGWRSDVQVTDLRFFEVEFFKKTEETVVD